MIEIHTTNYDTPIYCTICGTQTTDAKGSVVKCDHLVFFWVMQMELNSQSMTMSRSQKMQKNGYNTTGS